jgi:hypothetical protein
LATVLISALYWDKQLALMGYQVKMLYISVGCTAVLLFGTFVSIPFLYVPAVYIMASQLTEVNTSSGAVLKYTLGCATLRRANPPENVIKKSAPVILTGTIFDPTQAFSKNLSFVFGYFFKKYFTPVLALCCSRVLGLSYKV